MAVMRSQLGPRRIQQLLPTLICMLLLATPLYAAKPLCLRCHPPHQLQLGSCASCHRGNDRAARKTLAHHGLIPGQLAGFTLPTSAARERGQKLATLLACRRCHSLEQRGNRLASDLDRVTPTTPIASLRQALQTPAWYMPDFRLAPGERDDLLTYLLFAGKEQREKTGRELPQVIHFADDRNGRQDPFTRHCGGCHLTLSQRQGGLGQGRVAPNLAGLLGEFYPRSYGAGKPWTPPALKAWLANPRNSRPTATMPPLTLTEQEFNELVDQLKPAPR